MSLLDFILGMLTVACGIIAGTLLTWLISYIVIKRYAGRMFAVLMENREIKEKVEEMKHMLDDLKKIVEKTAREVEQNR